MRATIPLRGEVEGGFVEKIFFELVITLVTMNLLPTFGDFFFGDGGSSLNSGFKLGFQVVVLLMYPFKGGLEVKFTRKTRGLGFKIMRVRIKGKAG